MLLQNKLFTARIRRMREGNIVSLCSHLRGGTPILPDGGYPFPGLDGGGTGGAPIWLVGGTPSGVDGGTSVQTWEGGTPHSELGRG